MKEPHYPAGWDKDRVRRVLEHYENQSDDEAVAEDEAAYEATTHTMGISFPRLNEVVRGRRGVTPDTALRLARVIGMSADFWLGLQQDWDLWHAMRGGAAREIEQLKPLVGQGPR